MDQKKSHLMTLYKRSTHLNALEYKAKLKGKNKRREIREWWLKRLQWLCINREWWLQQHCINRWCQENKSSSRRTSSKVASSHGEKYLTEKYLTTMTVIHKSRSTYSQSYQRVQSLSPKLMAIMNSSMSTSNN